MLRGTLRALVHYVQIDRYATQKFLYIAVSESSQDPVAQWLRRWSLLATCAKQFLLLASVVTTRLSRLESWQGRQIKKSRMLLLNVCFVFPSCPLPQVANRHVVVSARDY